MNPLFKTLLCLSLCWMGSLSAAERPNVIFIAVDDLKPDIGAYGFNAPTPNIDRLAGEGTTFLNAHCQQAVCAPSRASLLTGRSPDYTQVWDLKTKIRDKRPDVVTLPQYFKQNGYETIGVGKIYDYRSVDKGQDTVSWSQPFVPTWSLKFSPERPSLHYQDPKIKALAAEAEAKGLKGWGPQSKFLNKNGGWPSVECQDVPDNAYDDGAMGDFAAETIRKHAGDAKPFFFAVGFKKPHLPFVAPKKYWDMIKPDMIQLAPFQERAEGSPDMAYHNFGELRSYSDIAQRGPVSAAKQRELIHGYLACVAYVDAQVGKILDALKEAGIADNTVIVFWGDHGWHLGDHGLWCKHSNFEQATRVPLIFAAPGGVPGQKDSAPVEFLDVFPTLCALTGLPIPSDLEGDNLAPVIEDGAPNPSDYAMSQFPRGKVMGYALRDDRYRYVAWFEPTNGTAAAADDPILAVELYDYETDPLETRNLAVDSANGHLIAEREQALRARLAGQSAQ
ncbi:sulfatase [Cerasicoccus maritimus]|uniref:sulfatase n=1 Tax=Cerasicoccus maritimus TaxID=490089 RepID=UPI00285252B7|nr:sulfatase [Cerasicoccus maritimus]